MTLGSDLSQRGLKWMNSPDDVCIFACWPRSVPCLWAANKTISLLIYEHLTQRGSGMDHSPTARTKRAETKTWLVHVWLRKRATFKMLASSLMGRDPKP